MSEKTEKPTPKKRNEAQEKGQVPKSKEVNTALLLLAGAWVVGPGAKTLASGIVEMYGTITISPLAMPTDPIGAAEWLSALTGDILVLLALPLLTLAGVAATAGAVQARGVLSLHPIKPQWKRISPLENGKNIFSAKSIAELVKSLAKLLIVVGALYVALSGSIDDILSLSQQSPRALLEMAADYAPRLLLAAAVAYFVLAGADYAFQLWQHEKGLRMSVQEIKEERKEAEGNPLVKTRMRSMGRSMSRNRMISSVAEADVVITNPTHIAIALQYDPSVAPAPTVLARGQRKIAARIKAVALEAGVPVIEDKPLAWALYDNVRVGTVIPADLYKAVAEVLAFVFRQRQRAQAHRYSHARTNKLPGADA